MEVAVLVLIGLLWPGVGIYMLVMSRRNNSVQAKVAGIIVLLGFLVCLALGIYYFYFLP